MLFLLPTEKKLNEPFDERCGNFLRAISVTTLQGLNTENCINNDIYDRESNQQQQQRQPQYHATTGTLDSLFRCINERAVKKAHNTLTRIRDTQFGKSTRLHVPIPTNTKRGREREHQATTMMTMNINDRCYDNALHVYFHFSCSNTTATAHELSSFLFIALPFSVSLNTH